MMISTLSENASFIFVSVGNEIRIRDGHKSGTGEIQRTSEKISPIFNTDSSENKKVDQTFNKDQIQASVARLQEILKHVDPRIELSVEKDINRVIFRVVDKETGDLIRQIPPEKVVELDRFLSGHSGLLVEDDI
jgi:flagellar protein FlaG